jgi:hypothetical protein
MVLAANRSFPNFAACPMIGDEVWVQSFGHLVDKQGVTTGGETMIDATQRNAPTVLTMHRTIGASDRSRAQRL